VCGTSDASLAIAPKVHGAVMPHHVPRAQVTRASPRQAGRRYLITACIYYIIIVQALQYRPKSSSAVVFHRTYLSSSRPPEHPFRHHGKVCLPTEAQNLPVSGEPPALPVCTCAAMPAGFDAGTSPESSGLLAIAYVEVETSASRVCIESASR